MATRDSSRLALKQIDGPLASTRNERWLWFSLPPQRWSFRSTVEREALITAGAHRFASLAGHRLHYRVTSRPYPVEQWARAVDASMPSPLPYWGQHLRSEQMHVLGLTLANKEVYLGVRLNTPRVRVKAALQEIREVTGIIAGPGLEGRPAEPDELEYLLHRSVSLGAPAPFTLPPPGDLWEEDDFAAFTDHAVWSAAPYARSVQIAADVNGHRAVRHVVTLTLGRMQTISIPEQMEPWMQKSDRLFPVEWSVTAEVMDHSRVKKEAQDALARVRAQVNHWADHGLDRPAALDRQRLKAVEVDDEVTDTNPLHTRVQCWVRAAVSGDTEDEALDNARRLADLYSSSMPFERGLDQYRSAREFIPGEPLANTAHKRRMPVTTFAAAIPAATAVIGDRSGFHIGSTAGSSQRAVSWHPWQAMEVRERSGTTVLGGSPGAGKSTLIGVVGYWSALARIRTVILDPSGPLARLCEMPELAPYSRAVDLMNAHPGSLSPYLVIGDPRPEHHLAVREDGMSAEQWQAASRRLLERQWVLTRARRRMLAMDTITALLPQSLLDDTVTRKVIHDAARLVDAEQRTSARRLLTELLRADGPDAEHARYIGRELSDVADLPQAQLIFAENDDDQIDAIGSGDAVLQVLTMRGNVLPETGKPRNEWSIEEMTGVPLMNLSAHLTARHIYSVDMNVRKLVAMDEVHDITRVSTGQSLIRRISRDTRKHNTRALLSGQNTTDATVAGIDNFLDGAFVGRTEGLSEQVAALRTLGVDVGVGYEDVLGGLSPRERQNETRTGFREFVWNDGDGGIEKIRVDVPERLRAVLDTTADPAKALSIADARAEWPAATELLRKHGVVA